MPLLLFLLLLVDVVSSSVDVVDLLLPPLVKLVDVVDVDLLRRPALVEVRPAPPLVKLVLVDVVDLPLRDLVPLPPLVKAEEAPVEVLERSTLSSAVVPLYNTSASNLTISTKET